MSVLVCARKDIFHRVSLNLWLFASEILEKLLDFFFRSLVNGCKVSKQLGESAMAVDAQETIKTVERQSFLKATQH